MEAQLIALITTTSFVGVAIILLIRLYNALVKEPERLRGLLRKQGISGPPPTFLLGNILEIKKARSNASAKPRDSVVSGHNCATTLLPFFENWRKQYGNMFMFSLGNTQILYINQPEVVKDITTCISLDLGKPSYQQRERGSLLGRGILTSNGAVWAHQRKILGPELAVDKVKGMIDLIAKSSIAMVDKWMDLVDGGVADINIDEHMRNFSGDVISRACFGSNYVQGEEIFLKLRALQEIASKKTFSTGIPGMRHLPTKSNRETWTLEREVKELVLKVVKERKKVGHENDLLQMVLEGARNTHLSQEATDQFIVDNCKNIYLAGYETTAVAASWCFMLLASNPDWQDRIRKEVLQLVPTGETPDSNMLRKMKQVSMVINETLRLYPPVPVISREALKDMKFGNLNVPKGVNVWTITLTTHTDPTIWGPNSYEFNPERFSNGIMGACKLPYMYMPFGVGPRVCLGQNLAMTELKILIATIVSKFSFTLSPTYVHSPSVSLVVEPKHGVSLMVKKL
ncbi:cytochrome P450 714C2-like [Impatiens glandulifera]|uniref:cytochrome P450 714C2-like n=1 Tax=Impatiens glandulifera TaxID=253017 RepID=UPI001FB10C4F|nr:cytochrome P450 714C2-like [Impatiens glandulifera]